MAEEVSAAHADRAHRFAAILILVLLLAPLAEAHILGGRPILQRAQRPRIVTLDQQGLGIKAELAVAGDPLLDTVTHYVDPSRGIYDSEHRKDGSVQEGRFTSEIRFERLVEFRDSNVNGLYEPGIDLAVKAWPFQHYRWSQPRLQDVVVADVTAKDLTWTANLTGAPKIRFELAVAGRDFTDEGAIVRPQDVIAYLDFTEMPPRNLGSLYALQGTVTVSRDTTLSLHRASNTSTALLADSSQRRALFVWGGEALLDGVEARIDATITDERTGDDGNKTATFILHMPTVDRSMRFVFVSGIEYGSTNLRAPMAEPFFLLACVALFALAWRRRTG